MWPFGKKKEKVDLYDVRTQALEKALGPMHDMVIHAVIPFFAGFDMGGRADVYIFKQHLDGVVYVTGDLLGEKQKQSDAGNYELMICHKTDSDWGPRLISALAYYTLDEPINSGETMDIGDAAGPDTEITAFLFNKYTELDFMGKKAGLMLCVGITPQELEYSQKHGGKQLIEALVRSGVYPFTDLKRTSVV